MYPNNSYSVAENFLYMMFATKNEVCLQRELLGGKEVVGVCWPLSIPLVAPPSTPLTQHDRCGRRQEWVPDPVLTRAMDVIMILHMDHEQNASTSTVRVAGSSQANPYACIAAGIACLWGPAHGGANEAVRAPPSTPPSSDALVGNRTIRVWHGGVTERRLRTRDDAHTFAAYMEPSVRATILSGGLGGRRETAA